MKYIRCKVSDPDTPGETIIGYLATSTVTHRLYLSDNFDNRMFHSTDNARFLLRQLREKDYVLDAVAIEEEGNNEREMASAIPGK